ncbi:MAG: phage replication initiation protein, NGO0469 family [Opitutia bacterium]
MGLTIKGGGDYKPHPAGPCAGLCVDVVDMGLKTTKFGVKDHVRIVWLTSETVEVDGDERPAMVSVTMTKTLGKDSNLRKLLEGWRGKPFTNDELRDGFDIESLVGAPTLLNIMHRQSADGSKTYANVASASRLPKGMYSELPVLAEGDYVRVADRAPHEREEYLARFRGDSPAPAAAAPSKPKKSAMQAIEEGEDDDLPF